jgi:hypothetical protein
MRCQSRRGKLILEVAPATDILPLLSPLSNSSQARPLVMCGIAGTLALADCRQPVSPDLLARMRDTMIHRGPDGGGLWLSLDRRVGLAHRRLSIIDLTDVANQPMCNEDVRCGSCSTVKSTTTPKFALNWNGWAGIAGTRIIRTLKSSCMPSSNRASIACRNSAACSRSACGTRGNGNFG